MNEIQLFFPCQLIFKKSHFLVSFNTIRIAQKHAYWIFFYYGSLSSLRIFCSRIWLFLSQKMSARGQEYNSGGVSTKITARFTCKKQTVYVDLIDLFPSVCQIRVYPLFICSSSLKSFGSGVLYLSPVFGVSFAAELRALMFRDCIFNCRL